MRGQSGRDLPGVAIAIAKLLSLTRLVPDRRRLRIRDSAQSRVANYAVSQLAAQAGPDRRGPHRPEDERQREQAEHGVDERHADLHTDREGEG